MQVHGFRDEGNDSLRSSYGSSIQGKDTLRFWYRQSPTPRIAEYYYNDWGEESFARITPANPSLLIPGELLVKLDAAGKLIWFHAVAPSKSDSPNDPAKPDWQVWFSKEFTGFDLAALTPIEDRGLTPPVAFDQLQAWRGGKPGGSDFYVQAAAYAGRPVYFGVFTSAEFERTESQAPSFNAYRELGSSSRQLGESMTLSLVFVVWFGACVLAWRNFRLGRSDRKGAFRVAFFLFCTGMLTWLFLASHIAGGYEVPVFVIGSAQAVWKAALFWVCYLALEPHVRRLWPQLLISWSRLVNGQWRDPLVGQNVLLGVLGGVVAAAVNQFQVLAPAWFGLTPQPFIPSHALTLDGPFALVGWVLVQIINLPGHGLFDLMILFLCRLVLRRGLLAACASVAVFTVMNTLFSGAHPVLGWFVVGIKNSIIFWMYLRLGFLAGIVTVLTFETLMTSPFTTNFSAWYAGNGLAVAAFFLALAAFGFYTSQAGRPIFPDVTGERIQK